MNHIGGDGFWLIREPSGRVRALMGAGRAGSKATPRSIATPATTKFRRAGRSPRSRCRARSPPGCSAQEAAKAQGGKLPLDVLLAGAIKHAREGYTVTRSQAQLTAEKLPEMKEAVGFRENFLIDGKVPDVGAGSSKPPSPLRSTISAMPGSTTSIAAMSAASSPPISSASAAR